jgi:hypothetical protein
LASRFRTSDFVDFLQKPDKYGFTVTRGPLRTHADWFHQDRLLVTHVTHWSTERRRNTLLAHYATHLGLRAGEAEIGMACHLRRPCLLFLLLIFQLLRQREENPALFHKLIQEAPAILVEIRGARAGDWNSHEAAAIKKRTNDVRTLTSWPEAAGIAPILLELARE